MGRGWIGVLCALGLAAAPTRGAEEIAGEVEQPIAAVQALLRQERLYSGPVDGVAGHETVAAIRRYQILHGLRATGRLEPDTLRAMLLPAPSGRGEITESDRELLRELAQTPLPDPVAERREPIPPGPPAAATPASQKPESKKAVRPRASKSRRSGGSRLSGD